MRWRCRTGTVRAQNLPDAIPFIFAYPISSYNNNNTLYKALMKNLMIIQTIISITCLNNDDFMTIFII